MTAPDPDSHEDRIVLHSSWTGIILAVVGSLLLVAVAVIAASCGGSSEGDGTVVADVSSPMMTPVLGSTM